MQLSLMTINLRYGTANDGEHTWANRRNAMFRMLQEYEPDVFGVQEGLRFQLEELVEALPGYACFGEGRYGLDDNEHSAIFYNVHRVHCLEGHTFWLSETPEVVGSSSWESSLPRLVTWGRFQTKPTGEPFYLYNTHFDHRSELARQKSAELVWLHARDRQDVTFLTGDFNCTEESAAWQFLTGMRQGNDSGDFIDAWHIAERQENPVSTYHGYRGPLAENVRIDWVLLRPALRVLKAETVVYQVDGFYPSDHFAVYVEVEMPGKERESVDGK